MQPEGADPKTKLALFTSDPEADPFAAETIKQANPAFGDFQNADEVLAMAEDARRMPTRESEYRNLILNQRVDRNSRLHQQDDLASRTAASLPTGPTRRFTPAWTFRALPISRRSFRSRILTVSGRRSRHSGFLGRA
jgi:hypothetical protein